MIINNTYFVNELYIPHAKPSVTSDVTTVANDLNSFINKYERECLVRCLGLTLYKELASNLDATTSTLIKAGGDEKWNELVNGKEYTINETSFEWRGLRFKNFETDLKPTRSLIANYVYWFFESDKDSMNTGVGNSKAKGKNVERVSAGPKVIKAWNEMIKMIQGSETNPRIVLKRYGVGLDYFSDNREVDLYKFINDSNTLVNDTYENFTPAYWREGLNEFGI